MSYSNLLTNFTSETYSDDSGKIKVKRRGRPAHEILADLRGSVGDHIKRVGPRVFANGNGKIIYFNSADELFGWVCSRNMVVDWGSQTDMVGKQVFLSYIGNVAEAYDCAVSYPHYPSVPGFYYVNKIEPAQTSHLDWLVKFFNPHTAKDRALLTAAFMTPFWGGGFGNRPGFLFAAKDDDEQQGRGAGKTAVTDAISLLCGGHVDLSKKSDDEAIRKALLSAQDMRVARFDNVKEETFSSATIESITTSPFISAHRLYAGHDFIPNIYTFYLTFNDSRLSKDLSQRFLTIRLNRPDYNPEWLPELNNFIVKYREKIIADIGYLISKEAPGWETCTRFPVWERAVLSKCVGTLNHAVLQASIQVDRDAVDENSGIREDFAEICREKMAVFARKDPEQSTYAVRQSWVVQWLMEFLGKKSNRKSVSRLLPRVLPEGFCKQSRLFDGIDYLVWSGAWHIGDKTFSPTSCWRVCYSDKATSLAEWPFIHPLTKDGVGSKYP